MSETRVFGLTGGIASGKSTVGKRFRELGVPVVDADQIARDVVAQGTEGLAALVSAFGEQILLPSGDLDRKALAAIAFSSPEKRATLNAITHPRIGMATAQAIEGLRAQRAPLVCYEAALLVENGLADAFRPLIVVAASEQTQIARAMARDSATEDEVRARVMAQMPLATKVEKADIVIHNDGELAHLLAQADRALEQIRARLSGLSRREVRRPSPCSRAGTRWSSGPRRPAPAR